MEKIGIVVSDFNADLTEMMLKVANEHADFLGANVVKTIRVPGVFDMPIAVKKLLKQEEIDGVATLGAVLEGDTDHDQVVAHTSAKKLSDLAVEFEKPVSLGFTGPKVSRLGGMERIEGYARQSIESVVKLIRRLK